MSNTKKILSILAVLVIVYIVYRYIKWKKDNTNVINPKTFWQTFLEAPLNTNGNPGTTLGSIGNMGNWYQSLMLSDPNWTMTPPTFNGGVNITNQAVYDYYKTKFPNPLTATEIAALSGFDLDGYYMVYPPAQQSVSNAANFGPVPIFTNNHTQQNTTTLNNYSYNPNYVEYDRQSFFEWLISKFQTIFN